MAEKNNERLHALVEGMVQGVTAEGPKTTLELLLKHLQEGPRSAHVSNVDVQWQAATNEYKEFRVTPSLYKISEEH
jgi:acylphosphatase